MPGASACPFRGQDFEVRIDETAQQLRVLVIDFVDIVHAEMALFFFFDSIFHVVSD
jgi:hypothetical protein